MKKENKYNSDTYEPNGELIPTVIVAFQVWPDMWMTLEEYNSRGKFKGLLKDFRFSIRNVHRIYKLLKHPSSYPTADWEP